MSEKEVRELLDKARRSLHAAERLLRDGFEDRAEGDYGLAVISEEQARAGIAAAHEFLEEITLRLTARGGGGT